jgi:hypothetical protein
MSGTDIELKPGHVTYVGALDLLTAELGFGCADGVAREILNRAGSAGVTTSARMRVYYSAGEGFRVHAVYSDARGNYLEAVPADSEDSLTVPAMADYAVFKIVRDGSDLASPRGKAWGYITDQRADGFGAHDRPTGFRSADEDATPYEAFRADARVSYIGETASIRGAISRIAFAHGKR